ncbi:MAG: tyrosine-type recombinase/integrase [Patescibacteria group bacterium]|nr:tyrosine-type recombinase/integrase [Patescibacteria group bacterium]
MLPHLDDYLLSLQTNNYSEETVYNYERDLKVFERYLDEEAPIPFEKMKRRDIEQYKAYLVSRDRKTATEDKGNKRLAGYSINRMLSSLRSYLKYLIDNDYQTSLSPQMVKLTKTIKKHPQVAELHDIVRLIESPTEFEKKNRLVALRNRAMLEVLFSTGMRISELLSLNKNQIDPTGKIFIMGKGRKQRFVYMTQRAKIHVEEYLQTRKDNYPALFIPYRGQHVKTSNCRIAANYLQMKIKEYRDRLRINVPTSAHSLRHGFATYLAESGANPAAIQILLGHESLDTTTRYVNASDRYAEDTHRKFHPLKQD